MWHKKSGIYNVFIISQIALSIDYNSKSYMHLFIFVTTNQYYILFYIWICFRFKYFSCLSSDALWTVRKSNKQYSIKIFDHTDVLYIKMESVNRNWAQKNFVNDKMITKQKISFYLSSLSSYFLCVRNTNKARPNKTCHIDRVQFAKSSIVINFKKSSQSC